MTPLLIHGLCGMGDNIFQRMMLPDLIARRPVWLRTCWPQLYQGIAGLRLVACQTKLRTQRKNWVNLPAECWEDAPAGIETINPIYTPSDLNRRSIVQTMAEKLGAKPSAPTLPDFDPPSCIDGQRVAVVRPVTVRREWRNEARGPIPEYIGIAARQLRAAGYCVVSIADLEDGEEWMVGPPPEADLAYHRGQLGIEEILGLVRAAECVVGGVGWLLPAAAAYRTPMLVIAGGQGAHNCQEIVTDPVMDLTLQTWIYPDRYCRCANMRHDCDKVISGIEEKVSSWVSGLSS